MAEGDPLRVQSLSGELRKPVLEEEIPDPVISGVPVHGVADYRQALGREMHADLVRAPSHEPAAQKREPEGEPLTLDLVERARLARAGRRGLGAPEGFHLFPVARVAADGESDLSLADLRDSGGERQ